MSVPKLPAGFRESIQPPALSPSLGWVLGVCAAELLVLADVAAARAFRAVGKECSSLFSIPTSYSLEIFKDYLFLCFVQYIF